MPALPPVMQRRVLVVDDDRGVRAVVGDQLKQLGFEIVEAENGEACLGLLEPAGSARPLHGVVLNLRLSMPDGYAVLRALRQRDATIPVIIMSELADIGRVRDAMKLGAQEYLVKPFDLELLRTKCLRVFLGTIEQDVTC